MNMGVKQCVRKCAHYATVAVVLKLTSVLFPDTAFYYFACTAYFILYVSLATVTYNLCKNLYNDEKVEADKKAVLITGCDSGFGNSLVKKLDSEGFQVFASCLFPEGEGAKHLNQSCSNRLRVLYLDVAKNETVEKALQFVENNLGSNVLWAVVNNAGISKGFSTDFSSIDDFKDTYDVNALGPVRVTKAFLPLLKESKGRVVNVTSLVARVAGLETCPYAMSKRAALGFTECLSLEMTAWGVHAISIEPEIFRTQITDPDLFVKRLEAGMEKTPPDILSSYGEEYLEQRKKVTTKTISMGCSDIDIVVDTIVTAVKQKYPDPIYKPRRNIFSRISCFMLENMPFELYRQLTHLLLKIVGLSTPKQTRK